jgi:hypothetical protein
MKVEWIDHKGKDILFVDYSGAKNDEELINILHKEVEIENTCSEKILCLVIVEGCHAGPKYLSELHKLGKEVRYLKVAKTVALGLKGAQKRSFGTYVRFTGAVNKPFENDVEAKE